MDVCVFSKHLQDYDFRQLGRAIRSIDVGGVDLTVRPGGHVEPGAVKDALPKAVATLKEEGVHVSMITTAITSADEPHARSVLETAAAQGIRYFKLGYYRYGGFGTFDAGLAEVEAKLRDLAALSKELGLWAGFHNHSGPYIGANPAHVLRLIDDLDPDAIGSYFDIGHATIEGAAAGWLLGLDDLAARVRMVAIKDLTVEKTAEGNRIRVVPLGEGLVRWDEFAGALGRIASEVGVMSFHGEYGERTAEQVLALVQSDRAFFENIWKKVK